MHVCVCVVFISQWFWKENFHLRERGYLDQPISVIKKKTLLPILPFCLYCSTNLYGESTAVSVMIGDGEQQASNVRV